MFGFDLVPDEFSDRPVSRRPWTSLRREFDRFFNDLDNIMPIRQGMSDQIVGSCDVVENDQNYLITMDMPGVDKQDIQVEIKNNRLQIVGERKTEREEEKEGKTVLRERSYGRYSRSFLLPEDVKSDNIHAYYENGVLKVELPKSEAASPRRVEIAEREGGRGSEQRKEVDIQGKEKGESSEQVKGSDKQGPEVAA